MPTLQEVEALLAKVWSPPRSIWGLTSLDRRRASMHEGNRIGAACQAAVWRQKPSPNESTVNCSLSHWARWCTHPRSTAASFPLSAFWNHSRCGFAGSAVRACIPGSGCRNTSGRWSFSVRLRRFAWRCRWTSIGLSAPPASLPTSLPETAPPWSLPVRVSY